MIRVNGKNACTLRKDPKKHANEFTSGSWNRNIKCESMRLRVCGAARKRRESQRVQSARGGCHVMTAKHPTGRRLPTATGAKTNGMWSRVLDKNSTSFAQECTVRLFLEIERSAGAAATSGVGLPGPAADHRNNFSSWQYLTTWWSPPPKGAYLVLATDKSPFFSTLECVKESSPS